MTIKDKSLKKHYEWKGKIETKVKAKLKTKEDLMLAYTPGVAEACLAIKNDVSLSYQLTGRGNTIAVITDGTAVLGLGDIGPEAGMPVMEGKAALFKRFGDVNVVPLCLKTKDTEEIIKTIKLLEGNFAGINLEDIAAPRCFEIEKRLVEELDIPVFHDDQHGTAIVVGAALINSLRLTKKKLQAINIVINGAGAAGIAIAKFLLHLGAKNLILVDRNGIISRDEPQSNKAKEEIALLTNHHLLKGILVEAIKGADVFIGVSVPNVLTKEMVKSMAKDPIVFPLANPIPEIDPKLAKQGGAIIVGTGSNQYPNQINNALVFPGLFKGALAAEAKKITIEMMASASEAIAYYITDEKLTHDYIVPSVLNEEVHQKVSESVRITAIKQGIIRK
ncbi:MAG: NADP-dependent malic enzyme [Acholeplasmataceae bacterium]|nr:NADP-dependent malic enzyme [Acholeplasmatales bacterium]